MNLTLRELHRVGFRIKNGQAVRIVPTEPITRREKIDGAFDSKLERDFARHLNVLMRGGEVFTFIHHPPPVGITRANMYTPDFLIVWADRRVEFAEVKGAKPREDDTLKCQMLKDLCPNIAVRIWRRSKGSWFFREF